MTKKHVVLLSVLLSVVVGLVGGASAFLMTTLVYLASAELAHDFHREIPNPSGTIIGIVFAIEVIAIGLWSYRVLRRASQSCITA